MKFRIIEIGVMLLFVTLFHVASAQESAINFPQPQDKGVAHVLVDLGTPDGREGGEDIDSAINAWPLPFRDSGNTSDNLNDYEVECPYTYSTSPDVVYRFEPYQDMAINVDLCGSSFDTKVYIYASNMDVLACNDDYYIDFECGAFTSFLGEIDVFSGREYYIVVDGYHGDAGDYEILIEEVEPCHLGPLIDVSFVEDEPSLKPDYIDTFNGGCWGQPDGPIMLWLEGSSDGCLDFLGRGGWFPSGPEARKDRDWLGFVIGESGVVECEIVVEIKSQVYFFDHVDCYEGVFSVVDELLVAPCTPTTVSTQGDPGDVIWLEVSLDYDAYDSDIEVLEYQYYLSFSGLMSGYVSTEKMTLDAVKCLFR